MACIFQEAVVAVEGFQLAYRLKALTTLNMASRVHGMDCQKCVYLMKRGIEEKRYGPIWILRLIERLKARKIVAGLLEVSIF